MFRQKLKGGHRVGPSFKKNAAPVSQPTVPSNVQPANTEPSWDAWGPDAGAWNWDSQGDGNTNGNQWHKKTEQYQHVQENQPQHMNPPQQVFQTISNEPTSNGQNAQTDGWNTWDEWGNEANLAPQVNENTVNNNMEFHESSSIDHHAMQMTEHQNIKVHSEILNDTTHQKVVPSCTDSHQAIQATETFPEQPLSSHIHDQNHILDSNQTNNQVSEVNDNWDWNVDGWSDNTDQFSNPPNPVVTQNSSSFNNSNALESASLNYVPGAGHNFEAYTSQSSSVKPVHYHQENQSLKFQNVSSSASSYCHNEPTLSAFSMGNPAMGPTGDAVFTGNQASYDDNQTMISDACKSSELDSGTYNEIVSSKPYDVQSNIPVISVTEPSPISTRVSQNTVISEPQSIKEGVENVNLGSDWEDGWDAKPESDRCDMKSADEECHSSVDLGNHPPEVAAMLPDESSKCQEDILNQQFANVPHTNCISPDETNQVQDHFKSNSDSENLFEPSQEFVVEAAANDIVSDVASEKVEQEPFMSMAVEEESISMTHISQPEGGESSKELSFPNLDSQVIPPTNFEKPRSLSLAETHPTVIKDRVRTVSESEGDINILKEELKDIFSAPTDLPDEFLPSEEKMRTHSLSLGSQSLAEVRESQETDQSIDTALPEHSIDQVSEQPGSPRIPHESTVAENQNIIHVPKLACPEIPNIIGNQQDSSKFSPTGAIPNLVARHGSPFQPPATKKYEAPCEAVPDFNVPSLPTPIDSSVATNSSLDQPTGNSVGETIQNKEEFPSSAPPPRQNSNISSSPSSDLDPSYPKPPSQASSSASEVSLTRMVPGQSSKAAPFKQVFAPPPAMPTDRVVTGNDNPQPMASIRVKQEPVARPVPEVASLNVEMPSSTIRPVRSETIGSEEPSIIPVVKDEKMGPPRHSRESWDRETSSGEYYHDRYDRDDRRYYKNRSPGSRHSYDSRYRDRRTRRYDSDDEADDEETRYKESRDRRRRGYRDYPDDRYHNRERRHDRRHESYSRDYDDSVFSKHDRSRPSSRSSSLTNLENEGLHRDEYYDKPRRQREGSYQDVSDFRSSEKYSRDSYMRGYPHYPDHYGSRQAYDPSYYYYYQKYMEQHPYYREYYKQYYGRNYGYPTPAESFTEDKGSTRSGRSSVNEEMKKSSSSLALYEQNDYYYGRQAHTNYDSRFRQDFHDVSGYAGYEPSTIYGDTDSVSNSKMYMGAELSGVTSDEITPQQAPQLTPLFNGPHLLARFGANGKLLLVLPNDPKDGEKAVVQVRDTQKMLAVNKQYQHRIDSMKAYPGPLSCNDTHKDVVIHFCEEKMRTINGQSVDAESQKLLWQYLALLVKHNGKICGADLASLLVQKKSTPEGSLSNLSESSTTHMGPDSIPKEENIDVGAGSKLDREADLVKHFMEYLCIGRKKEAVDYAIRQNLWGYAMTLAAKMDSVTHAKVMAAFINSMPSSDPFQTLIQHLSGKRPEVTKSFSPDRWGDWKEHLALLVSNPTGQLQRDQVSIITLGDTLFARGQVHAAHLCYLAADVPWGAYLDKSAKIVLLGASHLAPFQLFMTEEAFQCSEVYEYAKSLETAQPLSFVNPSYKLLYAMRLVECGFAQDALKYCEIMAQAIGRNPMSFDESHVSQVLDLGTRLKYHDVHYQVGQGEITEMQDPEWLQSLGNMLYAIQSQKLQQQYGQEEVRTETTGYQQPHETFQSQGIPEQPEPSQMISEPEPRQDNPTTPSIQSQPMLVPEVPPSFHEQPPQNAPPLITNSDTATSVVNPGLPIEHPPVMPEQQHPGSFQPPTWQNNVVDASPVAAYPPPPPPVDEPAPQQSPPMTNEEKEYWESMSNKAPASKTSSVSSKEAPPQSKKSKDNIDNKKEENKSGFFGSIFGWNKSNQAKLPDDSNPSIVWDEDKKRWVSTDGDEEPDVPLPPPPTIMAPPSMHTGGFRSGGIKASRYVDPVMGKPAKPISSASVSRPTGVQAPQAHFSAPQESTPTAPSRLAMPEAVEQPQSMPAQQNYPQPPPLTPVQAMPPQNLPQATLSAVPPPQEGPDPQTPVPMMGAPPMFSPAQFTKPSGSSTRKGPGRRTFAH